MTRINCVPPHELSFKHLLAEYREIPRVFNLVRNAQARGLKPADIVAPRIYTLGVGHVRFFYTRLAYLVRRQRMLVNEMVARGFAPQHTNPEGLAGGLAEHWLGDWEPNALAIQKNRVRLKERGGV